MNLLKYTLFFILITIISACGFHLRGVQGEYKFPFNKVYLDCNNVFICENFNTAIKTQYLAKIEVKAESADVTIRLLDEQTSKDPQAFNAAGRIAAYILTYQVQAQVLQKGIQLGDNIKISVRSIMNYNDSLILAVNQNEATFWNNLHENATNQLVRRLIYFKYYKPQNANNPK